ncbi:ankyrin repeat domain-containing protein [Gemmatimonadota bacterium]
MKALRRLLRSPFPVVTALAIPVFIPLINNTLLHDARELHRAAMTGRLDLVREIVAEDPDLLDVPDKSGYTPLRWAGIRGESEIACFLIESGAAPNTIGADGGTPLHGAAHHDDVPMMKALLTAGGDVTIRNQWGRTPLHVAARRGCREVAELLLNAGADPDAVTREGWSALNVAWRGGHPELVELLLAHGADPELADAEGLLPGDVELVRPGTITLNRRQLDQYVGHYDLGGGYSFEVWRVGDRMRLMEFAPDDIIPVAMDTFYCAREPWRAVFIRDAVGNVSGLEVDFLRQTVSAKKVVDTSEGFSYVGSQACFPCHQAGPGNGPAGHWIASRHSRAFHTLTTDQSRALAASREDYRDITDPSVAQRCLMCHVTAAQNPFALFRTDDIQAQGVGCEACHGPGSDYMEPEIMADREAFLANGGLIPDMLTCRQCHRDEAFDFLQRLERIRHRGSNTDDDDSP